MVLMAEDVTERKALEDQISLQALQDSLTGLPNRALFVDHLYQALARPTRQTSPFAVLLMDLDDFKAVNDSMGPETGDAVLIAFAERLREQVRAQDTVVRFGEDEFAVLLEGLDDLRGAVRVAERVGRTLLEEPFVFGGHSGHVWVSTGVAVGARSLDEAREILRQADLALSEAKKTGKGWYEIFDYGMDAYGLARLRTEDELRAAVVRGEFVAHYEPAVAIASGQPFSSEALVRWEHLERGLLQADDFVDVAEETGLVVAIGEVVLREACRQGALWQGRYAEHVVSEVSVNLSKKQLLRADLVEKVAEVLSETGMWANGLSLEVAEDALAEGEEEVFGGLRPLPSEVATSLLDAELPKRHRPRRPGRRPNRATLDPDSSAPLLWRPWQEARANSREIRRLDGAPGRRGRVLHNAARERGA